MTVIFSLSLSPSNVRLHYLFMILVACQANRLAYQIGGAGLIVTGLLDMFISIGMRYHLPKEHFHHCSASFGIWLAFLN